MRGKYLAAALLKEGVIRFNAGKFFTGTSGIALPLYFNGRMIQGLVPCRSSIVRELQSILSFEDDVDAIAGVQNAAIPHSVLTAGFMDLPHYSIRQTLKDHGIPEWIEGGDPRGKKIALIDDVATSGKSIKKSIFRLRSAGAAVTHFLCIFAYWPDAMRANLKEERIAFNALVTFQDLVSALEEAGQLDVAAIRSLLDWHERNAISTVSSQLSLV